MSTYEKKEIGSAESIEFYKSLNGMVAQMLEYAPYPLSGLCNVASLIFDQVTDLNWAGFYLFDGQKLVVGPFQGKPACTEIVLGKGVCGSSAQSKKSFLIDDVEKFEGHIACDSDSKSELVVPILGQDNELIGVIDLDSPKLKRFTLEMQDGFEQIAKTIASHISNVKII